MEVLRLLRLAALGVGVAIAFADSSIVVLALPDLLREFDASITGVSWVITSYNVVVAAVALLLVRGARGIPPSLLAGLGLVAFIGASIACGASGNLTQLVVFRCLQGLAGAALLAGSLPLVRALARTPERGAAFWALSGAIGAAIGPAAGGALTEAFDWRAIFYAQAPAAGLALLALAGRGAPRVVAAARRAPGVTRRVAANVALALVSGGLVGALFLVVVMLIDVWGRSPIASAAVVSALPVGTVAGRLLAERVERVAAAATGCFLLAAGLAGVGLVPETSVVWIVVALAYGGIGLGLAVPWLTGAAILGSADESASGTLTVAARHLGLVLGLLLVAPLLTHDLEQRGKLAEQAAAAVVLDADLPIEVKVPLAIDLANELRRTPNGEFPDFAKQFRKRERDGGDAARLRRVERTLDGTIRAVVTRAFRRSLLLSAVLALLALVPLSLLVRRRRTAA